MTGGNGGLPVNGNGAPRPDRPFDALILRTAEPADIAELSCLDETVFPGEAWGEESLRASLSHDYDLLLLALQEGRIAGWCLFRMLDEGELLRIGVDEACRGRGIGRRLMDGLLAEAGACGLRSVFLEVREGNLPAVSLYRSCGFEEYGRRKGYYCRPAEDALLMRLDLQTENEHA